MDQIAKIIVVAINLATDESVPTSEVNRLRNVAVVAVVDFSTIDTMNEAPVRMNISGVQDHIDSFTNQTAATAKPFVAIRLTKAVEEANNVHLLRHIGCYNKRAPAAQGTNTVGRLLFD